MEKSEIKPKIIANRTRFSRFVKIAIAVIILVVLLLAKCLSTVSDNDTTLDDTPAPVSVPDEPVTVPDAPVTVPDAPVTVTNAPVTVPDAPVTDTLMPENGQVGVTWTAPANNGGSAITSYNIYYSEIQGTGKGGMKVDAGNVTEFVVSGLNNGKTYYFAITAVNSAGEGAASDEAEAMPVAVPDAPVIGTLIPENGQVGLSWSAPINNGGSTVTGYRIYYSDTQGTGKGGMKVDTGNVTEFDVSGLKNGKTYYFAITAVNSAGEGAASDEAEAIPISVPDAPVIGTLIPENGQVGLLWSAPINSGGSMITDYIVYYSETHGSGKDGMKVNAGINTEFVVSGLTNGKTYYFTVTAVNSVGEGVASEETDAIPAAVPDAPVIGTLIPENGQVGLSWSAPINSGGSTITDYIVYYSETQGSGKDGMKINAGNNTEYVVSGLTNGKTYYFTVTAVNSVGEGAASDEANGIPVAVPETPVIDTLTSRKGQVRLSWTVPTSNGGSAITGYSIYYSEIQGSGKDGIKVDVGNNTEFVVRGLTKNTTYYFTVTATNSVGESIVSSEENILTLSQKPIEAKGGTFITILMGLGLFLISSM